MAAAAKRSDPPDDPWAAVATCLNKLNNMCKRPARIREQTGDFTIAVQELLDKLDGVLDDLKGDDRKTLRSARNKFAAAAESFLDFEVAPIKGDTPSHHRSKVKASEEFWMSLRSNFDSLEDMFLLLLEQRRQARY